MREERGFSQPTAPAVRTCLINIFLPVKCQLNAAHSINRAMHVSAVSCMISQPRYSMRDSPLSPHPSVWLRSLTSGIHRWQNIRPGLQAETVGDISIKILCEQCLSSASLSLCIGSSARERNVITYGTDVHKLQCTGGIPQC